MGKKAEELSQIQNAFAPSPLISNDEQQEFYENTSLARTGDRYSNVVESLFLQLSDSTEVVQHKLFIGHPGCGKTTELYQLLQKVKDNGFAAILGRCDLELDSADVEYTDVLFLILDLLIQLAKENEIELDDELVNSIYDYWRQDIEITESSCEHSEMTVVGDMQAKFGVAGLLKILSQIKGIIKNGSDSRMQIRQHIEPRSSELVNRIQQVIEQISKQCEEKQMKKTPLVILDGLDKIPLEQARKIFRENGSRFGVLNIHLIVTFPIALTYTPEYSDIQTWFPNPEKLPMIKLRKWENGGYVSDYREGTKTMTQMVSKRADLNLFEEDVLQRLIKDTGGYIRDLFRCISRAAVRARSRKAETISMDDAEMALHNLESDINGRYSEDMIPIMKRIYDGEKYVSSSDGITKLLQVGAVLEYNGERWCDLHPLVEKWLKSHGKI